MGDKQTCLEKKGMEMRRCLLKNNKWASADNEYTKGLIDEEYLIQSEFEVN